MREPQRNGCEVVFRIWEDSLPVTHPARLIWEVLGRMDLSGFVCEARAEPDHAGRSLLSRRMLLTIWGYAFTRNIIHAREIARLLGANDVGFRWIAADLQAKHSLLSQFLRQNAPAIEVLFTDVLGALIHEGLLFLPDQLVAQDGTRLQADAGTGSFRRIEGLQACREQAQLHLKAILARMDDPPLSDAQQLARERGAREVLARVEQAMQVATELQKHRRAAEDTRQKKSPAKASTTDPEARFMKMAEGGFAPGYNLQLSVAGSPMGGPIAIVGLRLINLGTDKGSLLAMRDQIQSCTGHFIPSVLVDSDHLTQHELQETQAMGFKVISCVPETWLPLKDPVLQAWAASTQTETAQTAYRARKSLVERAHAIFKEFFGIRQVPVRGISRVKGFCMLAALTFNIVQFGTALVS